ncbi:DUF1492 domain-containing protein [Streptococcus entericus]|uniref:DUF1492 domain-containing protein n=1 Tax=Streptococcus entericus TaxID=155680 RepID=UPI000379B73E|nr:DUF1492 domain-containing protein [Streptococcus entericus]
METGLFKQTRLTQTRVQTSRVNITENQLVAQLTLKEDITNRINRLTKERMELVSLIDSLKTPKHRLALNLYYVQQKLDIEAGEAMGVSRQTFFRYLRKVLSELAEVLGHAESDHEKGLRLG